MAASSTQVSLMKKVLIAGATGYLGRYVVKEFHNQGYWIRALVRDPTKLEQTGPFLQPEVANIIDDVWLGQVTIPETLKGICDGIDIVFSSIGITRQKGKYTYRDVDYQGNSNILETATTQSVKKFIYVSVFDAHSFEYLEIIKAHEDFVRDLQKSGIDYTIIRPTGYFSDMSEYLNMAKSGRVYIIGNGENRVNPIHGADLAKVCVKAVDNKENEIPVGGPEIFNAVQIAELAFSTLDKRSKITKISPWLAKAAVKLIRPFNKQMSDLAEFIVAAGQGDGVAPSTGTHTLQSYFNELASKMPSK
jgi:uncharacterized protein YbjT (DUF2867 family)